MLTVVYAGRLAPQREDAEAVAPLGQTRTAATIAGRQLAAVSARTELPVQQPELLVSAGARSPTTRPPASASRCRPCSRSSPAATSTPVLRWRCPRKDAASAQKVYLFTAAEPLRYLAFIVSRLRADRSRVVGRRSTLRRRGSTLDVRGQSAAGAPRPRARASAPATSSSSTRRSSAIARTRASRWRWSKASCPAATAPDTSSR